MKRLVPPVYVDPIRVCDLIDALRRYPPLMPIVLEGEGELVEIFRRENWELILQAAVVYGDDFDF